MPDLSNSPFVDDLCRGLNDSSSTQLRAAYRKLHENPHARWLAHLGIESQTRLGRKPECKDLKDRLERRRLLDSIVAPVVLADSKLSWSRKRELVAFSSEKRNKTDMSAVVTKAFLLSCPVVGACRPR